MNEWISVNDRLPEDGQKIIMLLPIYGYKDIEDFGIFKNNRFYDYIGELNTGVVSHWKTIDNINK